MRRTTDAELKKRLAAYRASDAKPEVWMQGPLVPGGSSAKPLTPEQKEEKDITEAVKSCIDVCLLTILAKVWTGHV